MQGESISVYQMILKKISREASDINLEAGEEELRTGEILSKEVMYWIGYIYRYWHYYTGEGSRKIYKQAPAKTMKRNYLMFHTMDPVLAIENLKEIYEQKRHR
ncbi:MAG: hypothetical protein KIC52_10070 [Firmicutes bacterium]|nr:hypothetical protein [Bacillota bacterium]